METEIFGARLKDTINFSQKNNKPKFLGFLSTDEKAFAEKKLLKSNVDHCFFGGYPEAERTFLSVPFVENCEFPISALTINFRKTESLTHRDFLGSLIGLGIKREFIGDILIGDGSAVVFLANEITDFVYNQLNKVGRVGVKITKGFIEPLPLKPALCELSTTVSSLRLDCIVSALGGFSRSLACEKISNGLVLVNSIICEKITKQVEDGDVLTIRGKGKFFIVSSNETTRKEKTILKYKKYI